MAAGSIVIDLLMKTGSFETDTKRAEKRLQDLQKSVKGMASDFGLAGVGIAGATTAFLAWTKATVDGIDALNDFADATGTTVENASALEDVALRTGTSLDTAQAALNKFNMVLKDTKAGDEASKIFQRIGLDAERLKGIDPAEALRQTAVALGQFADDGYKARIILELFGKNAKEIAPYLKDLGEQSKLVAKVTSEEAAAAEAFNKQIYGLQKNITDLSRTAMMPLVKQMSDAADAFNKARQAGAGFWEAQAQGYKQWVANFYGMGGKQGPVGGEVTDVKPSLLRNRQQMGVGGGGGVDWEVFEENRRKASKAAEEAIQKAKDQARAAERLREKERQDAWEIEKNNIMQVFEAEAKLREEGKRVYEETRTPLEKLNTEQARLAELLNQGAIDWDTYSRAVFAASDAYDEAIKKTQDTGKELDEFAKNAAENIQRSMGDTLVDIMEGNFKSIGDGFVKMLNRMVAEALAADIARKLFGGMVGGEGEGLAGGFLKMAGAFMGFGGAKATGGDVMAGSAYLVGEKGPEMFVPRSVGTILPNQASAPGPTQNINIAITMPAGTNRTTAEQAGAAVARRLAVANVRGN